MITVRQYRVRRSSGERFDLGTLELNDSFDALSRLVGAELCFGGQITELDNYRLVVETPVSLSYLDTSVFTGPVDQMEQLVMFAHILVGMGQKHDKAVKSNLLERLGGMPSHQRGKPLFVTLATPFFLGVSRVKLALVFFLGLESEKDIEVALSARTQDIIPAFQLAREADCSFAEVIF